MFFAMPGMARMRPYGRNNERHGWGGGRVKHICIRAIVLHRPYTLLGTWRPRPLLPSVSTVLCRIRKFLYLFSPRRYNNVPLFAVKNTMRISISYYCGGNGNRGVVYTTRRHSCCAHRRYRRHIFMPSVALRVLNSLPAANSPDG